MQEAGYILITPGGDWNADTTYHILHLVNHNGASWLCKVEECTGQEPSDSNTEFWQKFGTAVDLSNIDAKTLDGHGVEYFAKGTDLANYLPKSGGTVANEFHVEYNGIRNSMLCGTLHNAYLSAKNTVTGNVRQIDILTNEERPNVADALMFEDFDGSAWNVYAILHTGNKPTGTYTGNGSATQRTIATGGIGEVCLVYSANGVAIVTNTGTTIIPKSGSTSYTQDVYLNSAGVIVMTSDNVVVNESGATLRYQVL